MAYEIIPRTGPHGWGAKRPKCRTPQDPHNVREAFIHWPGQVGIARHVNVLCDVNENGRPDMHPEWCALPDNLIEQAGRITSAAQERAYMRGIQNFHQGPSRRWCDFAYSEAVFKSGNIYRGRGIHTLPAGQEGHNTGTWAILCVLGTADHEVPKEMREALKWLIHHLEQKAGHELRVRAHRSVNQTTCPGDPLARFVPTLDRV